MLMLCFNPMNPCETGPCVICAITQMPCPSVVCVCVCDHSCGFGVQHIPVFLTKVLHSGVGHRAFADV